MKMGKYHRRKRSFLKRFLNGLIAGALTIALVLSFIAPAKAAPRVDFIDVSHWNKEGGLPLSFYQTLKAGGIDGVVVKVSDGSSYIDPAASVNIANAKQAGMSVNAYHFARLTSVSDAESEARWFDKQLQYVGFDKLKDGIVVADVELKTASKAKLTEYTNAFISELHQLGYPEVDVYSGSSFYQSSLDPSKLSVSDPWLARYNGGAKEPAWYNGNRGAWQWSSSYKFAGISGNFDVSQDYAGKYSNTNTAPNSTPTKVVKKIGSVSLVNWLKSKGRAWSYASRAKLAASYGITGYRGTAAQNLALLSKLKSGVKPAPKPKATVSAAKTYTVRKGDTLGKIASKYKTTVSKLAKLNGIKNVNLIRIGQVIKLSGAATVKKATKQPYTVKKGDSLWAIAKVKKTTVKALKSKNKLKSDLIFPGQKLKY
ncbi:LysM peptidoglycan-binding domain-containing protein [Sporolactobacillus shoreicorticis]|uniref:GH25 family lysozyme n=1 Tax=Sporolactobacillus shoreicorticis TaxID=1923877 RepID=A0ABW5S5K0_9BACL|nr:GH25 family lysozyme [Sporolactobacillus shoreicorticis]MCO7127832.1 LysM peptidoglycan-binding domain-containing protein [Sporolactobacillus shoreicorticis]